MLAAWSKSTLVEHDVIAGYWGLDVTTKPVGTVAQNGSGSGANPRRSHMADRNHDLAACQLDGNQVVQSKRIVPKPIG
jgi:hypothetical protein